MIVAPPRTGTRGSLDNAAINAAKAAPYRGEHVTSAGQRPSPPRTFEACAAWFREAWEASLPTRLHTRGVEDGSALGSPRMAGAMHARIDHATDDGWGLTGWDKDGNPRGVTKDGLTRDPFLYYLERMLSGRVKDEAGRRTERLTTEAIGAHALVRWAYFGWDIPALVHETWRRNHEDDYAVPAMQGLLESSIRRLWHQCQTEPERWSRCPACKERRCRCGERSESQVNAEEAAA